MEQGVGPPTTLRRIDAYFLYTSHFLSMWNSKLVEYAVIIYVQAAFPGNLTASSIYGITDTVTALVFASAIGSWIDLSRSRLRTLLLTIFFHRFSVVVSCLCWFAILVANNDGLKRGLFAVALLLGMLEKGSRIANTFSMERDWVPTLASTTPGNDQYDLTHLNTVMRRIDISCKLFAPLAIAPFVSAVTPAYSTFGVATFSLVSWFIERWCVKEVHKQQPRLRDSKQGPDESAIELSETNSPVSADLDSSAPNKPHRSNLGLLLEAKNKFQAFLVSFIGGLRYFFSTSLWLPSICIGILHASVLNYGGTLVTFLLNAGFSLNLVTIARTSGSIFDFGSTLAFPLGVSLFLGGSKFASSERAQDARYEMLNDAEEEPTERQSHELTREAPNERMGLDLAVVKVAFWGLCSHLLMIVPAMIALFFISANNPDDEASKHRPLSMSSLIFLSSVSIALLGRWTYDLAITQLSQTLIPPSKRGLFAGTETQVVGCLSLMHWITAAIFHSQDDFVWIALASFVAIGVGTAAFVRWTRWWESRERSGTRV